jgi:glycosyltransferase involved in cell wall biosynthesis
MAIRAQTTALAAELGLTDRSVFFGDWVPYQDWANVLLEASAGISLHPDTAESRLAYRSRALDYIWSGLPMVVTRGDAISEIVEAHGLGEVVDYGDDAGVASAIRRVLQRPRADWQDQFRQARADLTWECAARPLIAFCRQPYFAADRRSGNGTHPGNAVAALQEHMAQRDGEIARLQALVDGYEKGRLMRLMRQAERWRKRVGLA